MYLNCKYPYSRFRKHDFTGMPLLAFLHQDIIDETDPIELQRQNNERLKVKLQRKRMGLPETRVRIVRMKYVSRLQA